MINEKMPKNAKIFTCKFCDFECSKYSNYKKHLETKKHKLSENDKNDKKKMLKNAEIFECNCGKVYKFQSGLSRHKKYCFYNNEEFTTNNILTQKFNLNQELNENLNQDLNQNLNENENNINYKELVVTLIKENNDIKEIMKKQQDQISELIPKVGNTTNNTINNNNNQKFNINLFLNEKCKDAITIDDFVHKIEITLKNLLTTKSKGIGIGINEIINENMNKLSVYERPIHCTDKKRETLYIKNETWEKDVNKSHTISMLKALQSRQFKAMKKWQEANPNYNNDDDLKHEYIILVNKCSSSLNDHEKKLFKNICDNTYIKDEVNDK